MDQMDTHASSASTTPGFVGQLPSHDSRLVHIPSYEFADIMFVGGNYDGVSVKGIVRCSGC
jgi:hypothetical protein